MFVGRKSDGTVYGLWASKQVEDEFHTGIEELPDTHPDVLAFLQRMTPVDTLLQMQTTIAQLQTQVATLSLTAGVLNVAAPQTS